MDSRNRVSNLDVLLTPKKNTITDKTIPYLVVVRSAPRADVISKMEYENR
ncbi:hypothetical protein MUTS9_52240 [Escherichia coli]|nr:hypothetical protein MUTS9_52240 [Escherichia coli]